MQSRFERGTDNLTSDVKATENRKDYEILVICSADLDLLLRREAVKVLGKKVLPSFDQLIGLEKTKNSCKRTGFLRETRHMCS
jgi:hypothetical protein